MTFQSPTILVLGEYRQTLAVLRSLGRRYNLVLGCQSHRSHVSKSRYVSETWIHSPIEGNGKESFREELKGFLKERPDIGLIFPVGDREIGSLLEMKAELPGQVSCIMPSSDVISACKNKADLFEQVSKLQIPTAEFVAINDVQTNTLIRRADEIGYPCVIKPTSEAEQIFGGKAFVAEASQLLSRQLKLAAEQGDRLPGRCLVQRYVSGKRRNIYFFAVKGALVASVEVEIDRTDCLDGTGLAIEGHTVEPDQNWNQHLQSLITALHYDGAGCLQYLVNTDSSESSFLEINSRLGANFAAVLDCGLDLPNWWVQSFLSQRPDVPADFRYPLGRRYTWLYGDLVGLKQALASESVVDRRVRRWFFNLIVANLRSRTHVTFKWTDPLPTCTAYARLFTQPLFRFLETNNRYQDNHLPQLSSTPAEEYVQG